MARTRSIRIRESLEELEQLRQYYQGRPQARRLLFLAFLKEDPKQTIADAARKADISDRRGRYWWDCYRKHGLQGLLERRVWKKEEKKEQLKTTGSRTTGQSEDQSYADDGPSSPALITLMNGIAGLSDYRSATEWSKAFRELLVAFFPDVDYVVTNIRHGIALDQESKNNFKIYRQHLLPDGSMQRGVATPRDYSNQYERLLEEGKRGGFPFERYHYPPSGFDYYMDFGKRSGSTSDDHDSYIGSLLLMRLVNEEPISRETLDLMERLRPYWVYVFTDFVARTNLIKPGEELFQRAIASVAGDVGLTEREEQVFMLELLGYSYQEIADTLHIALNTVQSHIRSIYQKAGVSKLSEFFSKYFTPRWIFEEKKRDVV